MSEKAPNYTSEQEAVILGAVPLDKVKAAEIGLEIGKETRSVIAKVKRMEAEAQKEDPEAVFYIAQPAYQSKTGETPIRKADLVDAVAAFTGLDRARLSGLDKAPKSALKALSEVLAVAALDFDSDDSEA